MATEKIDSILIATDGSGESLRAARYAAALAAALKPKVLLLHVIPNESIPLGTTQFTPEDEITIEKTLWEGAQVILDRTREPFDAVGVSVEGAIRRGNAAEEILAAARAERADLIVVGSHREGAERALLGSTSDAVARSAPCPVLVVRRGKAGTVRA